MARQNAVVRSVKERQKCVVALLSGLPVPLHGLRVVLAARPDRRST